MSEQPLKKKPGKQSILPPKKKLSGAQNRNRKKLVEKKNEKESLRMMKQLVKGMHIYS